MALTALLAAVALAVVCVAMAALEWRALHNPPEGMTQEEWHAELAELYEEQQRRDLIERFH